jgi:hypothetical protein
LATPAGKNWACSSGIALALVIASCYSVMASFPNPFGYRTQTLNNRPKMPQPRAKNSRHWESKKSRHWES